MESKWSTEQIMDVVGNYRQGCVLFAAAELDIFSILNKKSMTAESLTAELETDNRATVILLDALAAIKLLDKSDNKYSVPEPVAELLTEQGPNSVLAMVRLQGNSLRRWAQLSRVTRSGAPAEQKPSIRGAAADQAAFIEAMDNFSAPDAAKVVEQLQPLNFDHFLDVGGASGTWTLAFLQAVPDAKATLFDLPEVIPMAKKRIAKAGMTDRVSFAQGDFYTDDLPAGADFVWLGAIAHQNSRKQNQMLFAKIYAALRADGVIVLRDVVMDESRTDPEPGALFAVNMLVATQAGSTYTFQEYRSDFLGAGFTEVTLLYQDEFMNSLVRAEKRR